MGRGGFSRSRTKTQRSSIADKRLRQLLSELPPTNFSIQPHILETSRWVNNNCGSNALAITKSWLPTMTQCGADAHQRPRLRHVNVGPSKNPNPHPHNHFLGDSTNIAEAVYEMPYASYWCLLKSDTSPKFHPPPTIPSYRFDLLGPPLQLNGVNLGPNAPTSGLTVNYTVYRNHSRTSCSYKHASIRYECTTVDPFDVKKKMMEFTNVIYYEGKFYATSLQGALAVMQVLDTRLVITAVGAGRAVPSLPSRFFKEYLVEMKGEILLVFLIHEESLAVVDNVEVFRLDLDKLDWVKVERMRGKTMFLKEKSCDWVDSAEFGCRDDCVFFTEGNNENNWRVYDMKNCCISSVLLEN